MPADAAALPGHERLRDTTHLTGQSALDPFADPSAEFAQAEDQTIHAVERCGGRIRFVGLDRSGGECDGADTLEIVLTSEIEITRSSRPRRWAKISGEAYVVADGEVFGCCLLVDDDPGGGEGDGKALDRRDVEPQTSAASRPALDPGNPASNDRLADGDGQDRGGHIFGA